MFNPIIKFWIKIKIPKDKGCFINKIMDEIKIKKL